MKITDAFLGEHGVFYAQFSHLEQTVPNTAALGEVQAQAALLTAALETHAHLEEELLFSTLEPHLGQGGPLAVMRMGSVGMAHLLEREGVPTIMHLSCRDKNLIALQSTILEAAALGISALLPITGDPAKVGDQPQATSVYDLNSFELIRLIRSMNEGKGYSGASIQKATNFAIGCAFNPNVRDLDMQVRRLKKKIEAGAQFALPQPLYDMDRIPLMYERIRAGVGEFPVFFGVLPAVSARNAEFLAHEVPGIMIPQRLIDRMKGTPDDRQREEGVRISKELIDRALEYAPGFYIIPPFGSIDLSIELVHHIKARSPLRADIKIV